LKKHANKTQHRNEKLPNSGHSWNTRCALKAWSQHKVLCEEKYGMMHLDRVIVVLLLIKLFYFQPNGDEEEVQRCDSG
jgi:hypothetical protein